MLSMKSIDVACFIIPLIAFVLDCTSICEKTAHVKDVTCDDKTLKCLYTCNQGYAGDRCQYNCDYNCLECGTVLIK